MQPLTTDDEFEDELESDAAQEEVAQATNAKAVVRLDDGDEVKIGNRFFKVVGNSLMPLQYTMYRISLGGLEFLLSEQEIDPDGKRAESQSVEDYCLEAIRNYGSIVDWLDDWNMLCDYSVADVTIDKVVVDIES